MDFSKNQTKVVQLITQNVFLIKNKSKKVQLFILIRFILRKGIYYWHCVYRNIEKQNLDNINTNNSNQTYRYYL